MSGDLAADMDYVDGELVCSIHIHDITAVLVVHVLQSNFETGQVLFVVELYQFRGKHTLKAHVTLDNKPLAVQNALLICRRESENFASHLTHILLPSLVDSFHNVADILSSKTSTLVRSSLSMLNNSRFT